MVVGCVLLGALLGALYFGTNGKIIDFGMEIYEDRDGKSWGDFKDFFKENWDWEDALKGAAIGSLLGLLAPFVYYFCTTGITISPPIEGMPAVAPSATPMAYQPALSYAGSGASMGAGDVIMKGIIEKDAAGGVLRGLDGHFLFNIKFLYKGCLWKKKYL